MMKYNNEYFAAVNSKDGFVSFFSEIFAPEKFDRVYIIIGAPGTGKSTMLKNIGAAFEQKKKTVEYFKCSASPASLDGLIIDKRIALVDGTAPHIVTPKYPGAYEKIINTGLFWNEKELIEKRDVIRELGLKKNELFKKAYRYFRAAGEISSELESIITHNFDFEKLKNAANRFINKEIREGKASIEEIRIIKSINSTGITRLKTFEDASYNRCLIDNENDIGHLFLNEIIDGARRKKQKIYISYDWLNSKKPNAVFLPDLKLTIACEEKEAYEKKHGISDRYINMFRFTDHETIRENRQKIRFAKKCINTLIEGGIDNLKEADSIHTRIEKYYINAMNFKKLDESVLSIIDEIAE